MPHFCCIVGCTNKSSKYPGLSFYRLPKISSRGDTRNGLRAERRQLWLSRINRLQNGNPDNWRVCAKHFITGAPADLDDRNSADWAPILYLGHSKFIYNMHQSMKAMKHYERSRYQGKRAKEFFASQGLLKLMKSGDTKGCEVQSTITDEVVSEGMQWDSPEPRAARGRAHSKKRSARKRKVGKSTEEQNPFPVIQCDDSLAADAVTLPDHTMLGENHAGEDMFIGGTTDHQPITYQVISLETQKGQPQLVDSLGYTYTQERSGESGCVHWACSIRSETVTCNATVTQAGDKFSPGVHFHCHSSLETRNCQQIVQDTAVRSENSAFAGLRVQKIEKDVEEMGESHYSVDKEEEWDNNSQLGCQVEQKWVVQNTDEETDSRTEDPAFIGLDIPKMEEEFVEIDEMEHFQADKVDDWDSHSEMGCQLDQFKRSRNRRTDKLEFQLGMESIPEGFLRADIVTCNARHILLFSAGQEALLGQVKTVYLDRMVTVVQEPFEQIFSIHAFVNDSEDARLHHVPLAFCLMSRRRQNDYSEVLQALCRIVPSVSSNLKTLVMDFEIPLWQAVRELFGEQAVLKGCIHLWSEAVWAKSLEYKLEGMYKDNRYIRELIHWLLALPFLPSDCIDGAFVELKHMASLLPCLTQLFQYVETTFILGYWTPKDWSASRNPLRSGEDAEDWQEQISSKAGQPSLPPEQVITLLYQESVHVGSRLKATEEEHIMVQKRNEYSQGELLAKWQEYVKGH